MSADEHAIHSPAPTTALHETALAPLAEAATPPPAPVRSSPRRRASDRRPASRDPFVVAHRGASGALPEHTLPSFARAISLGADAVEVDVVATADGRLVARHEPELLHTTDVSRHHELLARSGGGAAVAGPEQLCTYDLALRDVTRLRARQRNADRTSEHDDLFMVPTFAQVLGLIRRSRTAAGRVPALHVELKTPAEHAELGLPLERECLRDLAAHGWNRADAPVLLQSFEADSLLLLAGRCDIPLLQLARLDDDGVSRCTERGLEAIATYAVGIGISRQLLDEVGGDVVARAHALGLVVHVYTFDEPTFEGDAAGVDPYVEALELGVDALITDYPGDAVRARDRWSGAKAG